MRSLERLSVSGFEENCTSDLRRSEYLSSIISAATLAPPGVVVETDIRCRKRPDRKQCIGSIKVRLQEHPAELTWWCPECSDSGVIRNWKGTPWPISHSIVDKPKSCGNQICQLVLSEREYNLLTEISIINPKAASIVQDASFVENGVLIKGVLDDWDSLLAYIVFEANHEQKSRRRLSLNKLFDKIRDFI